MFIDIKNVIVGSYPRLRVRFLIMFALWAINSGSFYGMALNTKNLGGNMYLNYVLNALVDIPGIAMACWLIARVFEFT